MMKTFKNIFYLLYKLNMQLLRDCHVNQYVVFVGKDREIEVELSIKASHSIGYANPNFNKVTFFLSLC